ncbi:hypothetical protein D9C73_018006 [Collichthys lucidus]|uniref:Uncharacterized protein n=1 Tax=Collichthys lucidus TaxID=240159 RepID=A0A4U5V7J6_COLLU|nr:hypothetical protein D9C73_018006 [Collichthys lucidus]
MHSGKSGKSSILSPLSFPLQEVDDSECIMSLNDQILREADGAAGVVEADVWSPWRGRLCLDEQVVSPEFERQQVSGLVTPPGPGGAGSRGLKTSTLTLFVAGPGLEVEVERADACRAAAVVEVVGGGGGGGGGGGEVEVEVEVEVVVEVEVEVEVAAVEVVVSWRRLSAPYVASTRVFFYTMSSGSAQDVAVEHFLRDIERRSKRLHCAVIGCEEERPRSDMNLLYRKSRLDWRQRDQEGSKKR